MGYVFVRIDAAMWAEDCLDHSRLNGQTPRNLLVLPRANSKTRAHEIVHTRS